MSEKTPGFEEHTPNRLDWLAVMINSVYPNIFHSFNVVCLPGDDGKTLIMKIRYDDRIDEKILDKLVNDAKDLVLLCAKKYKWDSWIEIEMDIKAI